MGTYCIVTHEINDFTDMITKACHITRLICFTKTSEHLMITVGVPFGVTGTTNILRIALLSKND